MKETDNNASIRLAVNQGGGGGGGLCCKPWRVFFAGGRWGENIFSAAVVMVVEHRHALTLLQTRAVVKAGAGWGGGGWGSGGGVEQGVLFCCCFCRCGGGGGGGGL